MFEVGKIYICGSQTKYKCHGVFRDHGWMSLANKEVKSSNDLFNEQWGQYWKEYKEPRTLTKWINVYEYTKGPNKGILTYGAGVYNTKKEAKDQSDGWMGESIAYKDSVEITYTEKI